MLNIKNLLSGDSYMIPMYQRNYAWQEDNLKQLVQDVLDSMDSGRNYYIGTLVVYNRENGDFETIDGQQRLTTLNIMLCAIKNEILNDATKLSWYKNVNITYEYRDRSSQTLTALYNHDNNANLNDSAITNMYDCVKRTIDSIVPQNCFDKFLSFLLDKVIITRVILPEKTDLNHYFEIMNSRGEQLEKHEILKAKVMSISAHNPRKCWLIGRIWDACSDMDSYVQMNFIPGLREALFGSNWDYCGWTDFQELLQKTCNIDIKEKSEDFSIEDVINKPIAVQTEKKQEEDVDRFNSIINFPNFLLQVLRVVSKVDIPLDDKRLIDTFEKYGMTEDSVDKFVLELLRLRVLFDQFVIKRDYLDDKDNGKWAISYLKKQNQGFSYNLTMDDVNRKLIMLQSMFHVSLPSQNYKHWLCATLKYLSDHNDGTNLDKYLEELAKGYMFGRFLNLEKNTTDSFYYNLIFNLNGCYSGPAPKDIILPTFKEHVDFFIFNYIDYCLWKNGKCPDFEFSSRSSVEHFYPQNPMDNYDYLDEQYLHSIGNLCLISSSKNSKLSNYQPIAKTEHYYKSKIDSVKQQLMMDIAIKNHNNKLEKAWWINDIIKHQEFIKQTILNSFSEMGK